MGSKLVALVSIFVCKFISNPGSPLFSGFGFVLSGKFMNYCINALTIDTFNKGKKDSTESNLNFLTRLKGMWDTMVETCSREKESVIPHAYKDEPGLVAHSITLIDKEMMEEIFKERIRDGKLNQMTTFAEFKDEILKYEQRSRAVNAMLGTAARPPLRASAGSDVCKGSTQHLRAAQGAPARPVLNFFDNTGTELSS